jgi:chromosome segregation ATPase
MPSSQPDDQMMLNLLTRGLESTDQIRAQMEDMRQSMSSLQTMVGVMQERTGSIKDMEKEFRNMNDRLNKVDRVEDRLNSTVNDLQKIEQNFVGQLDKMMMRLEASLQERDGKLSKLSERVDLLEKQQARWVGAMGVISLVIGFLMSFAKDWLKPG